MPSPKKTHWPRLGVHKRATAEPPPFILFTHAIYLNLCPLEGRLDLSGMAAEHSLSLAVRKV